MTRRNNGDKPPTHKEDPILTPTEVGRRIGKAPNTIFGWIKDGLLEAIPQPGGRWGVRESTVNRLLAGSNLEARV